MSGEKDPPGWKKEAAPSRLIDNGKSSSSAVVPADDDYDDDRPGSGGGGGAVEEIQLLDNTATEHDDDDGQMRNQTPVVPLPGAFVVAGSGGGGSGPSPQLSAAGPDFKDQAREVRPDNAAKKSPGTPRQDEGNNGAARAGGGGGVPMAGAYNHRKPSASGPRFKDQSREVRRPDNNNTTKRPAGTTRQRDRKQRQIDLARRAPNDLDRVRESTRLSESGSDHEVDEEPRPPPSHSTMVVPMAELVNEGDEAIVVKAERITLTRMMKRRQLGALLLSVFVVGAVVALIAVFAAAGRFGSDGGGAADGDGDTEPPPPTVSPITAFPATQPSALLPSPTAAPTNQRFCGGSDSSCWTQLGPDLEGDFYLDGFGGHVSLAKNGTRLAVCAPLHDDGNYEDVGLVRVYDIITDNDDDSGFVQLGQAIDGASGDEVYGVLSGDGSRLAVGARYHTLYNPTRFDIGQVRVLRLSESGSLWEQVGDPLYGEIGGDYFGRSVALSRNGTTVVIGATGHDSENGEQSGHVQAYSDSGRVWEQIGFDINGESPYDWSGGSVSVSDDGSVTAVGAENPNDAAGHVRVYQLEDGDWTQLGNAIDGEASGDEFGSSVSLSSDGTTVAAGAWANDGGGIERGHIRVFTYDHEFKEWEQLGSAVNGISDRDRIYNVALSADGRRIVTSASLANDGTGYVLVFDYDGMDWRQLGGEIIGQTTGERFGAAVALSADGTRLVVGATADEADPPKGLVRLYELQA